MLPLQLPLVWESFHPNARGQRELARILNRYIANKINSGASLTPAGLPANPPPGPSVPLATRGPSLPSIGDLIVEPDQPPPCDTGTFVQGQDIVLSGAEFAENAEVLLRLVTNDANYDLGTVNASATGDLSTVVAIPADAVGPLGTFKAQGPDPDGGILLLLETVQLAESFVLDGDGDGIPDVCDNCPGTFDADQTDTDLDGQGDACDMCVNDPGNDVDGDGLCSDVDPCQFDPLNDSDMDGFCADDDNCPMTANPGQEDTDLDFLGDACDLCNNSPVSDCVLKSGWELDGM